MVDFDGTLTNGELHWETEPTPNKEIISYIRELYATGNLVIIHTARGWGDANITASWLTKYKVPYHGMKCEKGGADVYLDDKSINVKDLKKHMVKYRRGEYD